LYPLAIASTAARNFGASRWFCHLALAVSRSALYFAALASARAFCWASEWVLQNHMLTPSTISSTDPVREH
jgi:hypothetical protein